MGEQINIGTAIINSINFLEQVYADTSKLLQIVEQLMNKNNMVSLYGGGSVWGRSTHFAGSSGWLVHYLNRVYVPKNSSGGTKVIFVNVYFNPEKADQPIVLYGSMKTKIDYKDKMFWPLWESFMSTNSGPDIIDQDTTSIWGKHTDNIERPDLEEILYKIVPLVKVDSKKEVEKMCAELLKLQ